LQPGLGGPAKAELDFKGVYRIPPEGGEPVLIADDFDAPNGIVFSPDEKKLFFVDSGKKHIRVFDVAPGWKITGGKVFIDVKDEGNEIPDGMKIDVDGNIFCTGPKGIWVINNRARLLGRIQLPEVAANLNWGGPGRDLLYITASTGLYRLSTLTRG
jgi:gluconolactonase